MLKICVNKMAFFTVTWRIENFSMCPQQTGEVLKSPVFTIPEVDNVKWYIQLYPRGDRTTDGDYVSCYLHRVDMQDQNQDIITLVTSFIVVNTNANLSIKKKDNSFEVEKKFGFGYPELISCKYLYQDDANGFLPNDVLTLQVHMRLKLGEKSSAAKPDVEKLFPSPTPNTRFSARECFLKENEGKDVFQTHCSFTTRIPVEQRILTWNIEEFNAKRKSKEKISLTLRSEFHDGPQLFLVCYVEGSEKENESLSIDILRKDMKLKRAFIKCETSFLDSSNTARGSKTSKHLFSNTYSRWGFSLIDKLESSEHLINNDSVKLKCDFRISYDPQNVEYLTKSDSSGQNDQQEEIKNMLEHEETSDVSFECKSGEKFPAHKFLICAKSPVFRAMFSNDTLERQTGVVRMQDTDTDTVRHLRNYLYSDSLPDLEVEDVLKLYSVADKYQMKNLEAKCTAALKYNASTDNVCEILTIADMHRDQGLKDYVYDFLIPEMDFDSDVWVRFEAENLKLAAETMKKCFQKVKVANMKK